MQPVPAHADPLHLLATRLRAESIRRSGLLAARRWASADRRLTTITCPADAIDRCWGGAGEHEAIDIVRALLTLAADDETAACTALVCVAPGLRAVARQLSWTGQPDDVLAEVVAEAWARLRDAAGTELDRPVAYLVWGTRSTVQVRARQRARCRVRTTTIATEDRLPDPGPPTALLLAAELVDAVETGRLSRPAARTVYATRVCGWSAEDVAIATGTHAGSVRRERAKAERALALAA